MNIPHQSGTFVTLDETTLTHHNHPRSIVYIRVQSWMLSILDLYKWMTCIHHYSMIQNYFHYPKNPVLSPFILPQPSFQSLLIYRFHHHSLQFICWRTWDIFDLCVHIHWCKLIQQLNMFLYPLFLLQIPSSIRLMLNWYLWQNERWCTFIPTGGKWCLFFFWLWC